MVSNCPWGAKRENSLVFWKAPIFRSMQKRWKLHGTVFSPQLSGKQNFIVEGSGLHKGSLQIHKNPSKTNFLLLSTLFLVGQSEPVWAVFSLEYSRGCRWVLPLRRLSDFAIAKQTPPGAFVKSSLPLTSRCNLAWKSQSITLPFFDLNFHFGGHLGVSVNRWYPHFTPFNDHF